MPALINGTLYDIFVEGMPHSEAVTYDEACWIAENARRLGQDAEVHYYVHHPGLFENLRSDPEEARRIWKSDKTTRRMRRDLRDGRPDRR